MLSLVTGMRTDTGAPDGCKRQRDRYPLDVGVVRIAAEPLRYGTNFEMAEAW